MYNYSIEFFTMEDERIPETMINLLSAWIRFDYNSIPRATFSILTNNWGKLVELKTMKVNITIYDKFKFKFIFTTLNNTRINNNVKLDGLMANKDFLFVNQSKYLGDNFKSAIESLNYVKVKDMHNYSRDFWQINETGTKCFKKLMQGAKNPLWHIDFQQYEPTLRRLPDDDNKKIQEIPQDLTKTEYVDNIHYIKNVGGYTDGIYTQVRGKHKLQSFVEQDDYLINSFDNLKYEIIDNIFATSFENYYNCSLGDEVDVLSMNGTIKHRILGKEHYFETNVMKTTLLLGKVD